MSYCKGRFREELVWSWLDGQWFPQNVWK